MPLPAWTPGSAQARALAVMRVQVSRLDGSPAQGRTAKALDSGRGAFVDRIEWRAQSLVPRQAHSRSRFAAVSKMTTVLQGGRPLPSQRRVVTASAVEWHQVLPHRSCCRTGPQGTRSRAPHLRSRQRPLRYARLCASRRDSLAHRFRMRRHSSTVPLCADAPAAAPASPRMVPRLRESQAVPARPVRVGARWRIRPRTGTGGPDPCPGSAWLRRRGPEALASRAGGAMAAVGFP